MLKQIDVKLIKREMYFSDRDSVTALNNRYTNMLDTHTS